MKRRETLNVSVGNIEIGGNSPISIQSMTNTDTKDIKATLNQVLELEKCGCDIVRLAIYDEACLDTISIIKKYTNIPLVGDIHFDYRLAVGSIKNGIDKIRINPGNIGSMERVKTVVDAARANNVPIRIGVNSGSLKEEILNKYGNTAQALAESALEHVLILEKMGYYNTVISLKSSDVNKTVEAYRYISQKVNYPLHLGVTEAGTPRQGIVKSSIGIGSLLLDGIGDTIRVSLTASPIEEVETGKEILKSLGLKKQGIEIISCPTCGRCNIDLINLANQVEKNIKDIKTSIKVAVMGCAVNGPGEAKEADIGIAGGKGTVVLFKKGQIIGTFPQEKAVDALVSNIREMIKDGDISGNTGI